MKIKITFISLIIFTSLSAFASPYSSLDKSCIDSEKNIVPGVEWHKINCSDLYAEKLSINVLDVDLNIKQIKIKPVKASDNNLETVPNIANRDENIIAGVNGGFFYNGGTNSQYQDPICPGKTYPQTDDLGDSLLQIDHQLISSSCDKNHYARSAFAIDKFGNAYIQQVSPEHALKNLYDEQNENVRYAIGGGPNLVSPTVDGKGFINILDEGFAQIDKLRAPRTAIGITHDKHILFVTIDGKKPDIGMTLSELAQFMANALQAVSAMNLDGGGSTTMCIKMQGFCEVVNQPSDGSPRKVHDGLFILD